MLAIVPQAMDVLTSLCRQAGTIAGGTEVDSKARGKEQDMESTGGLISTPIIPATTEFIPMVIALLVVLVVVNVIPSIAMYFIARRRLNVKRSVAIIMLVVSCVVNGGLAVCLYLLAFANLSKEDGGSLNE